MGLLYIWRNFTLATSLIGAILVVGAGADMLKTTIEDISAYFVFNTLAISAASLTILILLPLMIIDLARVHALPSLVIVEFVCLMILGSLWTATGAYAIWTDSFVFGTHTCNYTSDIVTKICIEWNTISAFSLGDGILLVIYAITTFIMALIARSKGYCGFTTTVREGFTVAKFQGPAVYYPVSAIMPEIEKPADTLPGTLYSTSGPIPVFVASDLPAQVPTVSAEHASTYIV